MKKNSFFQELKRRNVFKVATTYAIAGWLVIQVATSVFPAFKFPAWTTQFVIILVLIGFPIAVVIAWAFELTPGGVKRTEEVSQADKAGEKSNLRLYITLGVLLLLIVGFIFWRPSLESAQPVTPVDRGSATVEQASAPAKSVAVLPFENLSADSSNAYFAGGMQDMILTKLANIGELKVISRTSTRQYESHPDNLKKIGVQLGVGAILEGSVQKAGDQVLINVQLINTQDDHHIWAQSYQRTLKNIFGIEGEVAQRIAEALQAKLNADETRAVANVPTTNAQAYQLYLKAQQKWDEYYNYFKPELARTAISYLQQAVRHDPRFAEAYAEMAMIQAGLIANFEEDADQLIPAVKKNARKARSLQPNLAQTHQAYAAIYVVDGKVDQEIRELKEAARLAPNNARIQRGLAVDEMIQDNWKQAAKYGKHALRLDPRSGIIYNMAAIIYAGLRNYPKALQTTKNGLIVSPHNTYLQTNLGGLLFDVGKPKEAIARLSQIPDSTYLKYTRLADLQYRLGAYRQSLEAARQIPPPVQYTHAGLKELFTGRAELAVGRSKAGQRDLQQAVDKARAALNNHPKTASLYSTLAYAEAYLGQQSKALNDIDRAIQLWKDYPSKNFDGWGGLYIGNKAEILAHFKDAKGAMKLLDDLMERPGGGLVISPALLRIDKTWDPIRESKYFQTLLAKYPVESSGGF